MPRYKLTIEYEGTAFCGWQRQLFLPSVQQVIEEAALRFSGQETVLVYGAGRTDAGVHARGQVAHIDLEKQFMPHQVMRGINFYLKTHPVSLLAVEEVPIHFHARFSAKMRTYVYCIHNRRAPLTLEKGRSWHVPVPLDVKKMHNAGQLLLGRHNFNSFRSIRCQAESPVRTIDSLTVTRLQEAIHLEVKSPSFLHNQVRIIVGSLVLIGVGKWDKSHIIKALREENRKTAGPTAPSEGLYFTHVDYGDEHPESISFKKD